MATMRDHLKNLHKREGQHHVVKAAHHAAVGGHYQKLAAALGKTEVSEAQKDTAGILEALAGEHERLSEEHAAMAEHHQVQMEACSKATDAADLSKRDDLIPLNVSGVTPDRPDHLRMVARAGGPPVPEQPLVAEGFEKLVSIEE